jgi:copper chaperone CopZ
MENKRVKIPNISCGHCAHAIKQELGELGGVTSVAVDIEEKSIEETLKEINYPPEG